MNRKREREREGSEEKKTKKGEGGSGKEEGKITQVNSFIHHKFILHESHCLQCYTRDYNKSCTATPLYIL